MYEECICTIIVHAVQNKKNKKHPLINFLKNFRYNLRFNKNYKYLDN